MGEENVEALAFLTVITNDNARAANNLSRVAFAVNLAETSPCSEGLGVRNLEEVDLVLRAESLDELDVLLFTASLDQHTEVGLATVESLGALAETTSKTVVNQSLLKDFLKSIFDAQTTSLGSGSDLCLFDIGGNINGGFFNV